MNLDDCKIDIYKSKVKRMCFCDLLERYFDIIEIDLSLPKSEKAKTI